MIPHRIRAALAVAAAVAACCLPAEAAKVDLGIRVLTAANEAVEPVSPGVWHVPLGFEFNVVLSAQVSEPNFATSGPPNNRVTYPLGLSNLATHLVTSGVHVVDPLTDPAHSPGMPPRWRYLDLSTFGYPWVNTYDVDLDGDPDPVGAGFAHLNAIGGQPSSTDPRHRMGTDGLFDFGRGWYVASNVGTTSLKTDSIDQTIGVPRSRVLVFRHGTNGAGESPRLLGDQALVTDASITINVVETADGWDGARNVSVPEPGATAALAAASLLGLRRRKARR